MPEAANKIKHLINGEGIKIDNPKFYQMINLLINQLDFYEAKDLMLVCKFQNKL